MYRQKIVDVDAVNLMSAAGLSCAAVLSPQRRRKYIETMREFNTLGPINPQYHYHVNRVAVKAALREKVEKGRYMTLNAARQTGKTTLFRELIEELEATGEYFGILLDFEQLADFSGERFYECLSQTLNRWQQSEKPVATEPPLMRDQGDFVATGCATWYLLLADVAYLLLTNLMRFRLIPLRRFYHNFVLCI